MNNVQPKIYKSFASLMSNEGRSMQTVFSYRLVYEYSVNCVGNNKKKSVRNPLSSQIRILQYPESATDISYEHNP